MAFLKPLNLEVQTSKRPAGKYLTVTGLPLPKLMGRVQSGHWRVSNREWADSEHLPLRLPGHAGLDSRQHVVWIFDGRAYLANDVELSPEDVRAIVNQDRNKRRLALEKAHALQAMTEQIDKPRRRERISQEIRLEVWQRDGGRCIDCGRQENLEFDHIIPFGMGGANTTRNLQLLCGDCNRRKGMTLG